MPNEVDTPRGQSASKAARKPPRLSMDWDENGTLAIEVNGDWERIVDAPGSASLTAALIGQLAALGSPGKTVDAERTEAALGFVDAMKPRDPAEVLLVSQMAVTHQAVLMLARRLNHVDTLPQQGSAERALNKTARTFAVQMDTLKRYRSKGQQTVRVERVTVQEGGQAIIGNVETGGRGRDES
ncbi:hypothetical protein [Jannaschia formosa]|uniref:hypothetical protein n=1 Tax=Jannaschia formosa TaxID=2259592 RepID=UPI0010755991|nr:hypothetical protein [Jannaschia formosa]TFL15974.1 hypothetical protein DR046_22520 [Jannaschia formosa]